MVRRSVSLALALVLVACGQTGKDDTLPMEPAAAPTASDETTWLSGKQAYEEVCAGCHDEGLDGAPKTGDQADWDNRSWLWEAVLFEHAKSGHGDMPAKGGDAALDEANVTRAAEYMLTLTYPETHRD
jgi:cytochrome c5